MGGVTKDALRWPRTSGPQREIANVPTEWIKGLLAVPFVLYSSPHGAFDGQTISDLAQTREEAHRRYSEILHDVEVMVDDHSK